MHNCHSEDFSCDHAMIILVPDLAGGSNKREDHVAEGAAALCYMPRKVSPPLLRSNHCDRNHYMNLQCLNNSWTQGEVCRAITVQASLPLRRLLHP